MPRTALVVLAVVFIAAAAVAQTTVEGEFSRDPVGMKSYPSAPRLAQQAAIAPAVSVAPATEGALDQILEMQQWNDADKLPLKNGFTRSIGDPISVRLEGALAAKAGMVASHARGLVAASERGTLIWSGSVRVEKAHRVRLHLSNVRLPDGAVLWVYGDDQAAPIGFDKDLLYEGNIYTPSVNGPVVHLELEIPHPKKATDVATFEIRDFVEIFPTGSLKSFSPDPVAQDVPSCLIDATCVGTGTFDQIAAARGGVAHIQYVKGSGNFVCSGGLLNDTVTSSFIPYFLTANHCLNTQASATTIEAYFDYKTASCAGAFPPFPVSNNGATHLASNASSDFTLVRLNSIPGGRFFLGWTTAAQPNGTVVHRVSHPFPDAYTVPAPQAYSATNVNSTFGTCASVPLSNYLYSTGGQGGTYGGSSGSPAIIAGGFVVGQLLGACGTNPSAGCDNISNATVDGRFATTFPSISSYLSPGTSGGCTESGTVLCLNGNRFKVEATWQSSSASGTANVVEMTADTGYLWFFSSTNVEAVVKIVNGCGLNSRYWVFAAGLTDTRVNITVTDTNNGTVKTYTNPLGTAFAPIQDTSAFATCP